MPRTKGDIWKHFTQSKVQAGEGTEKKEVTQAKCNLCEKEYLVKDFSTTGIRKHLSRDHPEIFIELEKDKINQKRKRDQIQIDQEQLINSWEEDDEEHASAVANPSKKKQKLAGHFQPITQFIKYRSGDVKQLRADLEIMTYIATGNHPFQIVASESFKRLINYFDPKVSKVAN